jgi:DNA-binding transcriptional LysR family regulator
VNRRAVLTDPGEALLGYARSILQSLADADRAMLALKGLDGGRVTLGVVSTAKYIVPHMLARFRADHPSIAITLRDGNRREMVAAMDKGEVDLCVMGQPPEGSDVVAEAFAAHPSVIIAGPDHPMAGQDNLPPSALVGEPFIAREEGAGTRQLMDRFFASVRVTPRVTMTISSNETIKQAVMAGMGIALISGHTIGLELRLGLLRTLPIQGFPLMREWFVAHRRGMPMLPIHARLRGFLLRHGQTIISDLAQTHEDIACRSRIVGGPPDISR